MEPSRSALVIGLDVAVAMRDGVVLRADVYRPSEGRWPVLLQRTPYGKDLSSGLATMLEPVAAARAGYAVVVQDVRGRGSSEGRAVPFDEALDGHDTVEWAARQPWSDGRVGMFGSSYMAATQLQAASISPPSLVAISPVQASSDYYEGRTYFGGAFELASVLASTLTAMAPGSLRRLEAPRDQAKAFRAEIRSLLAKLDRSPPKEALRELLDIPALRMLTPWLFDWVDHDQHDHYWQHLSLESRYGAVDVPALHVTSWFDQFHVGTLRNFEGLRRGAATARAREHQYLIVGPWSHYVPRAGGVGTVQVGDLGFGPNASMDLDGVQLGWFARWLKGEREAFRQRRRVRLFVMGDNVWRDEDDWPLARAEARSLFLHSGGQANTRHGDGTLDWDPPGDQPPDRFTFDPDDPVPTTGGAHLAYPPVRQGPVGQHIVECRQDVLVYTSPVLNHDLEVTGWIVADIWLVSDAESSDVVVRLVDVHPDDRAIGVCDGIQRVHHLERDAPTPVTVRLGATSQVFLAGHRIRLQVTASNYPRFDVNPGNGSRAFDTDQRQIAAQRIFHDAPHASRVVLPIVPRSAGSA